MLSVSAIFRYILQVGSSSVKWEYNSEQRYEYNETNITVGKLFLQWKYSFISFFVSHLLLNNSLSVTRLLNHKPDTVYKLQIQHCKFNNKY